jgi:hypothetical protein
MNLLVLILLMITVSGMRLVTHYDDDMYDDDCSEY